MSETRNIAPPGGEQDSDDSTTPVAAESLLALNGHTEPTDDTPTIISRNGPRIGHEDPAAGLRGRRLAHFELIEPIGVGGMAAVIRARDLQLDRLVALKILPPDMANDPENVRRFHQEARSAARLDHENVARVFFCGEDQHLHFIAFEFVEGDNLRTILERRGRLPVAEALHYVLQVAAGLAHAAQRGVVHRDIKPSNIIITPTGRAKLVDMGLARSMERQDDIGLTQSGVTLGTFDYISPEQALEPREADVRSDIYSLGCTLYHVLTGHPPVPDGTAAKKLHHHQHVKPRDPREIVPGLPDEAAVILDRMMAKKPQDRYQSPEQLVHHLLLAARKLGTPANMPEGILTVEAALPPPPGGRPLLLAGMAAALVVALVMMLEVFNRSPAVSSPPPVAPRVEAANVGPGAPSGAASALAPSVKDKGPSDPVKDPPDPPAVVALAAARYDDGDAKNLTPSQAASRLVEWLKTTDKAAPKEIVLANDLDLMLPPDGEVGLALAGPKVTIQAKTAGRRPTVRFTHDARPQEGQNAWTAVSIDSPEVSVQGVRFLVDGQAADVRMVGLRLHAPAGGRGAFSVDNCEFIQVRPGDGRKRLASLEAATGDTAQAALTLTGCRFLSFQEVENEHQDGETLTNSRFVGEDAVVRDGPVKVKAVDCAFGPHSAAFRLEGGRASAPAPLSLDHCTVVASAPSAVFDVRTGATVALDLHACIFSRPDGSATDAGPAVAAVLIRQADADGTTCVDRDNRYHGLDAFWVVGDGYDKADWADFQARATGGKASSVVAVSPWKKDPLPPLQKYNFKEAGAEGHFADAFQVNDQMRELRVPTPRDATPAGVQALGGVDYTALLKTADRQAEQALKKQRFVEPLKNDSANRIYGTLEQALSACEAGDEILLRWDGPRAVNPVRLANKNLQDVTIRPDAGRRPVLRLTAGTEDREPALFRVYDGKLRLEGLEFLLQPNDDFTRQVLVDLAGQGQCALKNCVVTCVANLDRSGQPITKLAVASLSDPGKSMMQPMRPADQPPQLGLDNCFVRGDGDLVACLTSRPLKLTVNNTLTVLKGSFLDIEVGPDAPAAPAGQMALTLDRVTTYLTGNLIHLRGGKDYRNLAPVRCAPAGCLFVAARDGTALVHLDDSNLDDKTVHDKVLFWDGGRTSVYGNYDTMLDQMPSPDDVAQMASVGPGRWDVLWGKGTGKPVKNFHFGPAVPPTEDAPFNAALPLQFRSQDPADCGADVSKLPSAYSESNPK